MKSNTIYMSRVLADLKVKVKSFNKVTGLVTFVHETDGAISVDSEKFFLKRFKEVKVWSKEKYLLLLFAYTGVIVAATLLLKQIIHAD